MPADASSDDRTAAQIVDENILRGKGGETHQVAEGAEDAAHDEADDVFGDP